MQIDYTCHAMYLFGICLIRQSPGVLSKSLLFSESCPIYGLRIETVTFTACLSQQL
jgi:hypothetical protein